MSFSMSAITGLYASLQLKVPFEGGHGSPALRSSVSKLKPRMFGMTTLCALFSERHRASKVQIGRAEHAMGCENGVRKLDAACECKVEGRKTQWGVKMVCK